MNKLTVENLYGGGVVERIHEELDRVIANIIDPNTPAKKTRKVKMTITIKPNEQRNMAEVLVATSSELAPPEAIETSIFIGADPRTGEVAASEVSAGENPQQHTFPDTLTKGKLTKVTPFPANPADREAANS